MVRGLAIAATRALDVLDALEQQEGHLMHGRPWRNGIGLIAHGIECACGEGDEFDCGHDYLHAPRVAPRGGGKWSFVETRLSYLVPVNVAECRTE